MAAPREIARGRSARATATTNALTTMRPIGRSHGLTASDQPEGISQHASIERAAISCRLHVCQWGSGIGTSPSVRASPIAQTEADRPTHTSTRRETIAARNNGARGNVASNNVFTFQAAYLLS